MCSLCLILFQYRPFRAICKWRYTAPTSLNFGIQGGGIRIFCGLLGGGHRRYILTTNAHWQTLPIALCHDMSVLVTYIYSSGTSGIVLTSCLRLLLNDQFHTWFYLFLVVTSFAVKGTNHIYAIHRVWNTAYSFYMHLYNMSIWNNYSNRLLLAYYVVCHTFFFYFRRNHHPHHH